MISIFVQRTKVNSYSYAFIRH